MVSSIAKQCPWQTSLFCSVMWDTERGLSFIVLQEGTGSVPEPSYLEKLSTTDRRATELIQSFLFASFCFSFSVCAAPADPAISAEWDQSAGLDLV